MVAPRYERRWRLNTAALLAHLALVALIGGGIAVVVATADWPGDDDVCLRYSRPVRAFPVRRCLEWLPRDEAEAAVRATQDALNEAGCEVMLRFDCVRWAPTATPPP
jgi:hypothetical protein